MTRSPQEGVLGAQATVSQIEYTQWSGLVQVESDVALAPLCHLSLTLGAGARKKIPTES